MEYCNKEEKVELVEILEFALNDDNSTIRYATEILYVNEVYSVKSVTLLPCTPSFIIGIINFRGKIISVIDIRNFLGFTSKRIDADTVNKIIVMKLNEIEVGIAVEEVVGCSKINLFELQNDVLTITNFKEEYFKGITKERTIVLDMKNILMDEKIIVNEVA